jgi:hypothetical protein
MQTLAWPGEAGSWQLAASGREFQRMENIDLNGNDFFSSVLFYCVLTVLYCTDRRSGSLDCALQYSCRTIVVTTSNLGNECGADVRYKCLDGGINNKCIALHLYVVLHTTQPNLIPEAFVLQWEWYVLYCTSPHLIGWDGTNCRY